MVKGEDVEAALFLRNPKVPLANTHTHSFTRTHTHNLSFSHSHSLTLSLSLSLSHTHTHTHTLTHTSENALHLGGEKVIEKRNAEARGSRQLSRSFFQRL